MSNLYPQLNANNGNNNGGGSFDDYDSIIDEFSIGCGNSDISSMHMSDMGEIAAGIATTAATEEVTFNTNSTTTVSDAIPSLPLLPTQEGGDILASGTDGAITTDCNDEFNDHRNNSANSYYYHVGDLYHVDTLGIDNTDMSAILGLASSSFSATSIGSTSSVDAESLMPNFQYAKEGGDEEDQHSLPSVYAIKNDFLMMIHSKQSNHEVMEAMNNHNTEAILQNDEDEVISASKQLGPLGDELSYVENNSLENQQYEEFDTHDQQIANYVDDYSEADEEEDDANNCILPNLVTYSSRRSKCVTVFSTAFILGVLVFAIVAVGVSYSSTGSINPFSSSSNAIQSIGGSVGASSDSASLVNKVEDGNNHMNIDSAKLPLESSSDNEEDEGGQNATLDSSKQKTSFTALPTVSLTMAGTSTAAIASSTSSLPTPSPRDIVVLVDDDDDDDDEVEDTLIQQQQQMKIVPTSMPSEQPSLLRRQPSTTPTLSSNPSSLPSVTSVPSIAPTISSQPSWPIGNESTKEGDARFYLMADGGSNRRFWANNFEKLQMEQHKFIVHLGSAIRAVDDCDPDAYARTEESLSNSPIPVYSIPGDNDYPKCTNPSEGWENYQQSMMNINAKYWDIPQEYDVKRQVARQENFSFLYRRVLFIGMNMVSNTNDDWETVFRLQDNIDWVRETVEAYWDNADAIFVMGYGRLLATESAPFYDAMVSMTKKNEWADKLFVYARRSSELDIYKNVGGNKNFIELRVAAEWPILDVRVRTRMNGTPELDFAAVDENEIV